MPDGAVLADLRAACDGAARTAEAGDRVAGVPARYVASPTSTEQVSAVLRASAAHRIRVVVRGAGTKLDWGAPPAACDLVVDLNGLTGLVEHASGDLVVVARAGTPYETLRREVSPAGQQLALDPGYRGATLGGIVATNTSGPRRLLYGTARDLLIGVTFVRADGVVARSGGRVVKNVAGYDLGKLLTGSYGTLGVITEVVFRLHPLPDARRYVVSELVDADALGAAVDAVVSSQVAPTAVEIDKPTRGDARLAVLVEGTAVGVAERAAATAAILGGADVTPEGPDWFGRYPFGPDDVAIKLTAQPSGLPVLLSEATRIGVRYDLRVSVRGSAVGVLYAAMSAPREEGNGYANRVAAAVDDLRAAAQAQTGSVVVLRAPDDVRPGLDVWGPVHGLGLMRNLKREMDPAGLLAPGRFVGGI